MRKPKKNERNWGVGMKWHPENITKESKCNVQWVDEDGDLVDTYDVTHKGIKSVGGVLWTRWKDGDGVFLLNVKDIIQVTEIGD